VCPEHALRVRLSNAETGHKRWHRNLGNSSTTKREINSVSWSKSNRSQGENKVLLGLGEPENVVCYDAVCTILYWYMLEQSQACGTFGVATFERLLFKKQHTPHGKYIYWIKRNYFYACCLLLVVEPLSRKANLQARHAHTSLESTSGKSRIKRTYFFTIAGLHFASCPKDGIAPNASGLMQVGVLIIIVFLIIIAVQDSFGSAVITE
jgi:hypothetical protein